MYTWGSAGDWGGRYLFEEHSTHKFVVLGMGSRRVHTSKVSGDDVGSSARETGDETESEVVDAPSKTYAYYATRLDICHCPAFLCA